MRRSILKLALILCLCWPSALTGLRAETLAQFKTVKGVIDVELFDADKPVTVRNFIRYVQSGVYRDLFFHRWVPQFVLQGGGYVVPGRGTTSNPAIQAVPVFGNITNEYGVGRTFSNAYGTLAMARVGGQTNSANSQWFFNVTNNPALDTVDGGFTVFGRVISGTNILNLFFPAAGNGIYRATDNASLTEIPVVTNPPTLASLVYVDITLWSVRIQQATNGLDVTWDNVFGKTNQLEFTDTVPAVWQTLVRTNNPRVNQFHVVDPGKSKLRFYRVRIDPPP